VRYAASAKHFMDRQMILQMELVSYIFPSSSPDFYLADHDFFPPQLANLAQQTCSSSLWYFLVAMVR
jgi:hypothetical protein